jgi:hypothetical protein
MPGLFLTELERARLSNFPSEIAANDVIGFFTLTLEQQLERNNRMDSDLYDDKLAGEITKERYQVKHDQFVTQKAEIEKQLRPPRAPSLRSRLYCSSYHKGRRNCTRVSPLTKNV